MDPARFSAKAVLTEIKRMYGEWAAMLSIPGQRRESQPELFFHPGLAPDSQGTQIDFLVVRDSLKDAEASKGANHYSAVCSHHGMQASPHCSVAILGLVGMGKEHSLGQDGAFSCAGSCTSQKLTDYIWQATAPTLSLLPHPREVDIVTQFFCKSGNDLWTPKAGCRRPGKSPGSNRCSLVLFS